MSKISVADALDFANVLTSGAQAARAAGQTDFDLTQAVDDKYAAAKTELEAAIAAAKSDPAA